jgi:predicted nucleotidyltransferase
MQHTLSALLFPGYRRAVLGLLLLRPDEALHGREIARRTGLPSGTLTRELNRLAEAGLLKRVRQGNQRLYSANRACPVFEEVAGILRKTAGLADVLADALAPAGDRIEVAFVFGSLARGRETTGSDVDLMLIGDLPLRQAVALLEPAQRALAREVNPRIYTAKEWRARLAAKDPFVREVMAKPKVFVIGTEHELAEPRRAEPRSHRAIA